MHRAALEGGRGVDEAAGRARAVWSRNQAGEPLAALPRLPGPRHLLFSHQVVVAVQVMQGWWAVMIG